MEDIIQSELKLLYKNNIHSYCGEGSLQLICFEKWVKCFTLTKAEVNGMCLPPILKHIIKNYSEFLECDYCARITWDFEHRILHIKESHMEEIYAIISGIRKT